MNSKEYLTKSKLYSLFEDRAGLNRSHNSKRRSQREYLCLEIVFTYQDIESIDMNSWWDELIGIEFIGYLRKSYAGDEVVTLKFIGNTRIIEGRTIPMKFLSLK